MANINRVVLSGHLTRDPELRSTAGGSSVLSIGIAVNDRRKNQQTGQWEDYPNFVDCIMFGNRAEGLSKIVSKGTLICVEGKLRYSSWERDGQRRSKIEVIVEECEVLSRQQPETRQRKEVQYDPGFQRMVNEAFGGYADRDMEW